MTEVQYWIWMQDALGIGSRKVNRLLERKIHPKQLYEMNRTERLSLRLFTEKELENIAHTTLENAEKQISTAQKMGAFILTPDMPNFPEQLLNIHAVPCVLYGKGDLGCLEDTLALTIVGARKFTEYGYLSAFCLARDLAAAGCVIVSGMAHGNDYAAHVGALSAGGRTIGILACGLDVHYPIDHDKLKNYMVSRKGLLLSEFPFGSKAHGYHFSIRNRILSGISRGVIVTQAAQQSGSLITAGHAMEQNRDVFAVPGNIFDLTMAGCNKLIRDGAKMVLNVYSILEEYLYYLPEDMTPEEWVEKIKAAQKNTRPVRMPSMPAAPMFSVGGADNVQSKQDSSSKTPSPFAVTDNPSLNPEIPQEQEPEPSEPIAEPEPEPPAKIPPMLTGKALKAKKEQNPAQSPPPVQQDAPSKRTEEVLCTMGVSAAARRVYGCMELDAPMDVSALTEQSGCNVGQVLASMTELEVQDLVRALPGKQFVLI